MKKALLSLLVLSIAFSVNAQSKKKKDQNAIKEMCGCFEVTFNFAETFNYSDNPDYKPSKTKISKGLEWGQLVTDEKNKISIQHLLIVGPPSSPYIVKHWRQDWLYQNRDFYMYNGDNVWNYEKKAKSDVKKQWTQKVFQVDDSPRYEGTSKWIYDNKKTYWESTADAPLPRRDNTKRSDYNVLRRRNRNFITDSGWRHEQDNEKIYRTKQLDSTLVYEKGVNIYKKVDDKRCQPAINWWETNKDFWQIVRNEWDIAFDKKSDLQVQLKSEGKSLIKTMYVLNDEWNQKKNPSKKKWQKKIKSTINNYILQKEI